ncbi:MAG: TIGR02186 family protein [Roseovarius sp.]|nr:TIGR02186 family protein [Roseovarius sp.]MCY4290626.1 TIGR02186 family protein [Roseovarius sp.]MCY4316533.1 TIGR02186 family protein [Roseovarius sp.]
MHWLAVLFVCMLALPGRTEEVVLGLSKDKVAITATFDGSEILVFGAIKREEPIPKEPLGVIVTIQGPLEPLTVRKKERRFGIWVNAEAVDVKAAPSFYAVATTGPFREVLTKFEDIRERISIPRAISLRGMPTNVTDPQRFSKALIRIREESGAYQMLEGAVALDEQTLFRTSIKLPSNLTEGDYSTRIFLTRNGYVVSRYDTVIDVRKVGLENWLYNLSREQPLAYGLMSLAIAIAAGWFASAAFRLLRER